MYITACYYYYYLLLALAASTKRLYAATINSTSINIVSLAATSNS